MRVGVNCFLLQPHIGGLRQYFLALFDWLFENDPGNEYILFYFQQNVKDLAELRSDAWKKNAILLEDQSLIAAHLGRLDVYFCPFSALWPRPAPLPSVVTLVDIQEMFYPQFFARSDLFSREYHYPSSTRAADRVITISEYSKATLVEHHGLSPRKVIVAHLCADPRYHQAQQIQAPPDAPIPFTDFVFFPANRWPHKNHDVLLKALKILAERSRAINAVFTGFDVDGGYPLMQKAVEYGVRDRVHSAGYVSVAQMAYLYAHAEMLVFPSLFEGFGMPPVEAMSAGCAAVVAKATCLPEICRDSAEYFDPHDPIALADAICRVHDDPARRNTLIESGYSRSRVFTPELMARAHLRAFDEAIQTYSPARYRWHQLAYQPYHVFKVNAKYAVRGFIDSRRTTGCRISFSRGWYPREAEGSNWLRWNNGVGRLTIHAPCRMTIRIVGACASLIRPNEVQLTANGALVASWAIEGEFSFQQLPQLTVELRRGRNRLEFRSRQPGAQPGPNDSRLVAIAIRNLAFSDVSEKETCRICD
jgi:glycosyltransferase involved in cell wall biosynthesis